MARFCQTAAGVGKDLNIDEKQLSKIWKVIASHNMRSTFRMISKKEPLSHREIVLNIGLTKTSSAYYIKKLTTLGLIKRDERMYYLTRIGLQVIKVMNNFEKICMKYDLSDVNAEGKIIMVIER